MSHIQALRATQQHCNVTGDCVEYHALLQHEQVRIDSNTAAAVHGTIITGSIIALIGLVFLLTAFIKPLQKFQLFVLPKLAIITPVLAGFAGGALVGFVISFSACFTRTCTTTEHWAMLIVPLFTLIITVPLAIILYKKRQAMSNGITNLRPQTWIVVGVVIIFLALAYTAHRVAEQKQSGESGKQYLLTERP